MRIVVDEGEDDGMEHGLGDKGRTWWERQQDAGRQNEKQDGGKQRHHGVKHGG